MSVESELSLKQFDWLERLVSPMFDCCLLGSFTARVERVSFVPTVLQLFGGLCTATVEDISSEKVSEGKG